MPAAGDECEATRAGPAAARRWFITGMGVGQIVSWGTFYYTFPLIAGPMGEDLGVGKPAVYGAATFGLAVAGLAAYPVGAAIDRGHGRAIMAFGSAAGGLLFLGWSQVTSLWAFYLLFAGIGLVQAMTLYEPAFAVVARRYGADARAGITVLTLWGGFASTVFVPLTQLLLDHLHWRDALVVLGLINLVLCVGLYWLAINPKADAMQPATAVGGDGTETLAGRRAVRWAMGQPVFWGLLVALTLFHGTHAALIFHLYPLLLERGFDVATTVAAVAIFGPSQVAGRIAIWLFAGRLSIRAIGMANVLLFPLAIALLLLGPSGFAVAALFGVLYGTANGIMTIVRGLAVPDMLTREAYGAINGALAAPAIVVRALAPLAAAVLWSAFGAYDAVLLAVLATSVLMCAAFWFAALAASRPHQPRSGEHSGERSRRR